MSEIEGVVCCSIMPRSGVLSGSTGSRDWSRLRAEGRSCEVSEMSHDRAGASAEIVCEQTR